MILFAVYLELSSSILSSLISGKGIVTTLILGPTPVLTHLLQLELLIGGIILAWSLLRLTTYWEILLL